MSSYERGLKGEEEACRYLESLGMSIVCRRFRAEEGEVDVIARRGKTLHFVEVKYRPEGRLGSGLAAIDEEKRRRFYAACKAYLRAQGSVLAWQIDHLEITRAGVQLAIDTARQR